MVKLGESSLALSMASEMLQECHLLETLCTPLARIGQRKETELPR